LRGQPSQRGKADNKYANACTIATSRISKRRAHFKYARRAYSFGAGFDPIYSMVSDSGNTGHFADTQSREANRDGYSLNLPSMVRIDWLC
jgi:hypothetical protein